MAHALAGRGGDTSDIADHRLGDVLADELRSIFLGRAADLADHDDALGLRVVLKQAQAVDEAHAVNGIAADADAGALAEARTRGLMHGFIGQGAGTRHDTDAAWLVNGTRHDADLTFTRRDDARAVGSDQTHLGTRRQARLDAQHVEHRNAFGDAGDDFDAGVGRFTDSVGGERRRHEDHAGVGASVAHGLRHGVEYWAIQMAAATASGGDAADYLRAVGDRLLGMESALLAGEALHQHAGCAIDQN